MTTATATPSCRVTRSRVDTRPANRRPGSAGGVAGWPSDRTGRVPLARGSGRSAFTVSLPLRRRPLQLPLEVVNELAGMVYGAADSLQGGRVLQPVGPGAQPAQLQAKGAAAPGGLAGQLRLGVLGPPLVDRGLLAVLGRRMLAAGLPAAAANRHIGGELPGGVGPHAAGQPAVGEAPVGVTLVVVQVLDEGAHQAATSPSSPARRSGWTGARSSTAMAGCGTAASTAMARETRRRERNQGRSRIRTGGKCPYTSRARRGLSCRSASRGSSRRYAVDSVREARPSPPVVSEVWVRASSPTSLEASSREAGSAWPLRSSLARWPFRTVAARWP